MNIRKSTKGENVKMLRVPNMASVTMSDSHMHLSLLFKSFLNIFNSCYLQILEYYKTQAKSRFFNSILQYKYAFCVVLTSLSISHGSYASECKTHIEKYEKAYDIPLNLMQAIAVVESRHNPNALNIAGKSKFPPNAEEAIAVVLENMPETKLIDIGCMQLNIKYHMHKFGSLEEMIDPENNVEYAAKFLKELYAKTGSWKLAVSKYHSSNPANQKIYTGKVLAQWLDL
jgi:soluble lytic murein transglycosylase-like protein